MSAVEWAAVPVCGGSSMTAKVVAEVVEEGALPMVTVVVCTTRESRRHAKLIK